MFQLDISDNIITKCQLENHRVLSEAKRLVECSLSRHTFVEVLDRRVLPPKPLIFKPIKSSALIVWSNLGLTGEDARKRIIQELVVQNLPIEIKNRISMKQGGLIAETKDDANLDRLL